MRENIIIQTFNKEITLNEKNYKLVNQVKVLNKKLVFITNFPNIFGDISILKDRYYLGYYGTIKEIKILNKENYSIENKSSKISLIVEFEKEIEATLSILGLDKLKIGNYILRANYGTIKLCNVQLFNKKCSNKNCQFFHGKVNTNNSYFKTIDFKNTDIMAHSKNKALNYLLKFLIKNKLLRVKNSESYFRNLESILYTNRIEQLYKIKKKDN